jgi:hypothetical protein
MVVYLQEALDYELASGVPLTNADIGATAVEGQCSGSAKADDGHGCAGQPYPNSI